VARVSVAPTTARRGRYGGVFFFFSIMQKKCKKKNLTQVGVIHEGISNESLINGNQSLEQSAQDCYEGRIKSPFSCKKKEQKALLEHITTTTTILICPSQRRKNKVCVCVCARA
jgi:hypothetical protein